jgi:hypothetical protein
VNCAVICLFHAKAGCGSVECYTLRMRKDYRRFEAVKSALGPPGIERHFTDCHTVSLTILPPPPHTHTHTRVKTCISRDIVLPSVTQKQVDADMSYVAFMHA